MLGDVSPRPPYNRRPCYRRSTLHVSWSVCVLDTRVSSAETDESIEMRGAESCGLKD